MRIAITGATGFIGWRLANTANAEGHEVIAFGRTNSPFEEYRLRQLRDSGISIDETDFRHGPKVSARLQGVEAVYHLAAAQHEANVSDEYFRNVNVKGTEFVLDACVSAGVKRLIYGSTIGIYGSALDGEISEQMAPHPDNIYEITKYEAEKSVRARREDIEISIIRISETYGPGDGRLLKLFKAIRSGVFFMIGKGDNIHQLVFIDDLVNGLLNAAHNPAVVDKTIVFAGKERLTTTDMCQHVAQAVDTPMRTIGLPLWLLSAAATVIEGTCRPLRIQPPLHQRRLDFFRKSFFFDTTMSDEILGAEPFFPFSEGAKISAEWYRDNGWLDA